MKDKDRKQSNRKQNSANKISTTEKIKIIGTSNGI